MNAERLFLFDNGPSLARVVQRPVVRHLAANGVRVDVAVNADDDWLFADLAGEHVALVRVPLPASEIGAIVDQRRFAPRGVPTLDLAAESHQDTRTPNWRSLVVVVERGLRALGMDARLVPDPDVVPMADLPAVPLPFTPRRRTVYLDLDRRRDERVHFVFDLPRLLALLPDHDFACTARPPFAHERLVDVSAFGPLQRATLSTQCETIVGRTWLPFVLTLHEANRWKPKIVCGHDPFTYAALWDHAGNPLEHVATMDQLADFLRSHAHARA